MGDYIEGANQPLNDMNITDNGDIPKVMATTVKIIHRFLTKNPQILLILKQN
jgi:hypothetical protein